MEKQYMKYTPLILILSFTSCVQWSYDEQGQPKGYAFAAKATKMIHTKEGFYAEGLDTQTGFKDAMDFGGTLAGTYFGGEVMKAWSADSIAVDQSSVKAGTEQLKATEKTKQIGIKEAASVEKAKIHAETIVP